MPAGAALVTKATQVVTLIIINIAKTWNVNTGGSASVLIFITKTFYRTVSTCTEMMIHYIMS